MSDEVPPPPFVYDGLDPALEEKSVISEVADAVKGTAQRIGEAVDSGRIKIGDYFDLQVTRKEVRGFKPGPYLFFWNAWIAK